MDCKFRVFCRRKPKNYFPKTNFVRFHDQNFKNVRLSVKERFDSYSVFGFVSQYDS